MPLVCSHRFYFIEKDSVKRIALMDSIFYNGFTMFFILISITAGIALPMLILRKNTVKKVE